MTNPQKKSSTTKKASPFSRSLARHLRHEGEKTRSENSREADMDQSLKTIYGTRSSKEFDALERPRSHRWVKVLFGFFIFCLVLAGAAWAGFFFFQPLRPAQTSGGLHLTLIGSSSPILGQTETYELHWSNEDVQPLLDTQVRLNMPADFVTVSSDPVPTDAALHRWDLGLISPKQEGVILVKGVFTGALETKTAIQVLSSYRLSSNTEKDLETFSNTPVVYTSSVLKAGVSGLPEKVIAGDALALRYTLTNQGNQALNDLSLRVMFPQGFMLSSSSSSGQEIFFPLSKLPAGASSTVVLSGSFASGVSGSEEFVFEAGRKTAVGFVPMQKSKAQVPVIAGDLWLRAAVNGSDADKSLEPGAPLHISVAYKNTSVETLRGVTLEVAFESVINNRSVTGTSLIKWSGLEDSLHGTTSTKTRIQTLRFDKKQIAALEALTPQTEGSFDVTLPTSGVASGTRDALIRVSVQSEIQSVGQSKVKRVVHAQPITLRYRSDADVHVEARAFTEEGAPLGFGPLPPAAGKTTAYRLFWNFSNHFHALDGVVVSAVLPKIARWSARADSDIGSISYDEATRTVFWKIDHVSDTQKQAEASFEVQLTPEIFDIGRFAALLGETKFQAQDPSVNETISRIKPALSTDLQNDEGAKGKGVVVK